jgi:hypothetical protein
MTITFLLCVLLNLLLKVNSQAPIVCISDGCVRGVEYLKYHGFLGIPFAKPPVGNLRFKVWTKHDYVALSAENSQPYFIYRTQFPPIHGPVLWMPRQRSQFACRRTGCFRIHRFRAPKTVCICMSIGQRCLTDFFLIRRGWELRGF